MGWLDFLHKEKPAVCPVCRSPGARQKGSQLRCPNRLCAQFDVALPMPPPAPLRRPGQAHRGGFDPGPYSVRIQYRNYRGEEVELVADRRTCRDFGRKISLRVAPTGARITLRKQFIRNPAVLGPMDSDRLVNTEPRGVERQILSYHLRRGTSSPRFKQVRQKYPDWTP